MPKLYRYRFDPNPKARWGAVRARALTRTRAQINGAMQAIWKAIVPDPKQAVDRYFGETLQELVRDAGCGATAD